MGRLPAGTASCSICALVQPASEAALPDSETVPELRAPIAPGRDLGAFLALITSLSARLATAHGELVAQRVDESLRELLEFFGVDQCGIMEIQPDRRKARLRHRVHVDGVPPAPTSVEYGVLFPWTHERNVFRGQGFVQTCLDDLPAEAGIDRASSIAIGMQCVVTIPVGPAGETTHVLCLTSRRPTVAWPEPILAQLRLVAETFMGVLSRHRTEEALELSERTLAEAQRIAGIGSFVRDWRDETIIGSNEANRILGGMLGEAGKDLVDFVAPADAARFRETHAQALAERAPIVELEYRIDRPDGSTRIVQSRVATSYASGQPTRALGTIRDVTELRAAEEESRRLRSELRHADRAAHAGALTASLSHELNQPLTGILANAQAALHMLGPGDRELREVLDAIVRDDKRAAGVVENVRALLRREEPKRSTFPLDEACSEVLVLFKAELDANRVRLHSALERRCSVRAVRTQIQQLVLNLVANALHAMRERPDGERTLALNLARIGEDRAEIRVSDSGVGIAAEHRTRIFDPFFTTRSDGLGMGLAICHWIVEAHGGEIVAEPNDEGGTTFRCTLPVEHVAPLPSEVGSARHETAATFVASDDATVCIVDDDEASRLGVARLLSAEGWPTVAFASAADALASPVLAHAQCVVLDVQMPGMNGTDLQAEMARRGIATPIVFLSARSDAPTGVEAMKRGAFEYLAKPADADVLIDAVRRGLSRGAALAREGSERREMQARLARLTAREVDVLRRVVAGRLNKQIAAELAISEATVKQHRGQVMDKMRVRSVADLVRACDAAGFDPQ